MKRVQRARTAAMLLLDLLLIGMEIYALGLSWAESGAKMLRYYTQLSNLLALLTALICAFAAARALVQGRRMAAWTRRLRHLAASCMLFTLLASFCLLSRAEPGGDVRGFMLEGKYLYLHTLCPVLITAQLFAHPGPRLREKHALLALIPTLLYGGVSLLLNRLGAYSGPYPFLRVMEQPGYVTAVGCIAMLGVNYFCARLLAALSGRKRK